MPDLCAMLMSYLMHNMQIYFANKAENWCFYSFHYRELQSEAELNSVHKQLSDAKKQALDTKKQLQDKIATLESKLTALSAARDFDKSASEHKLVSMMELLL